MDSIHHDFDACGPSGFAEGNLRCRQGRRRLPLAVVLADHLSADASSQRHRHRPQDYLSAEACRHRHQRNRRRAGRGDRYRIEFHLPRISRSVERRIRHNARRVLSGDHNYLRPVDAAAGQPLDAESNVMESPN